MEATKRKWAIFALVGGATFVLDEATKIAVRHTLPALGAAGKSIIGRTVVLTYAENTGVAFSQFRTLPGGRILLSVLAAVALASVISYVRRADPARRGLAAGLGLVAGGAAGNLCDRALLGNVTDFVLVDLGFWPFHPWAVFNVADVALVVGLGVLVILMFRHRARESPQPPAAPRVEPPTG